jgi:hypothetical protein
MTQNEVTARYVPEVRTIVGTDLELTQALRRQSALGRLLTPPGEIKPRRVEDGRWAITVRLARPLTAQEVRDLTPTWWKRHRRHVGYAALALTLLAVIGGIVTLLISLFTAVADNGSYLLAGAIGLSAVLFAAVKKGHPCTGLHCAGCKDKH